MLKGPYKMGTISRLTGFSSVLLRAWERRHGLLQPERGPGGHRLYTDDDLIVLRRIQELMGNGRSIGEIAALGREALIADARGQALPSQIDGDADDVRNAGLDEWRREIVRAAIELNAERLNRRLDTAAAAVSFPTLIERVIVPAAREIGDLWKKGDCTVASEHLASSIFIHRIRKLIESAESMSDESSRFAIAACLPGEEHELGLLILSYFLNRSGVRVLYLGANLPFDDVRHACWASRPGAVLLSVTRKGTFRKHRSAIKTLTLDIDHETLVYLGGSGSPVKDAELEDAGLRLAPRQESAQSAAQRIRRDLAEARPIEA